MQDCIICNHDGRIEIETAIRSGRGLNEISELFGLDPGDIWVHSRHEFSEEDEKPLASPNRRIFQQTRGLTSRSVPETFQSGNLRANLTGAQRVQAQIAQAKVLDRDLEAKADKPEAFTQHPMWQDIKTRIFRSLEAYPEAYRALLEALDV
jgi:hypothetical protein